MMNYKTFLAAPKVSFGVVDVRDVAEAHIKAMQTPETDGKRILITSTPSVWFGQILKWLRKEFLKQGLILLLLFLRKTIPKKICCLFEEQLDFITFFWPSSNFFLSKSL